MNITIGKIMKRPRFVDLSILFVKYAFNTRFFIAGLTRKSRIIHKIIDKFLFEGDEMIVIPNTLKLNKNKKTSSKTIKTDITINKTIEDEGSVFLPTDILKEIIRNANDIVIMDTCLCRKSNNCKDYPQDIGCLFIGPTSRKIPRHIGKEATTEEALYHVDLADSYGLSHVMGRNKIDTIWMNIGPKEGLLTVCHCCPCCCLWKVLPNLTEEISDKIEKLDGVTVKTNSDNCNLCKRCLNDICFADAISFNKETNKIEIDQSKCRGCGACVNTCVRDAISINYIKKSVDTILDRIDNLVDYKK